MERHANADRITVLLADDNLIVREGVRALLSRDSSMEVIGVAADYDEVISQVLELRPQGLGTAPSSAVRRSANPCMVSVDLADRYREEIEAAVYFCCLEAIQNAGKHAPDAAIEVCVSAADGVLTFEVRDDGPGFEVGESQGAGFVNMADRLGAVGGRLRVISASGNGTTVRGGAQ